MGSALAKVGTSAFSYSGNSESIVDLSSSTLIAMVGDGTFYNFKGTIVVTGLSALAKVGASAFSNYHAGNSESIVDLSSSKLIDVIGDSAFSNFNGTIFATGMSALTKVGKRAFHYAGNTESIVDLSDSLLMVEMGEESFLGFKGTVVLPTPTMKPVPSATLTTTSTTATITTSTTSSATITPSTATTATITTPTTTTTTTAITA